MITINRIIKACYRRLVRKDSLVMRAKSRVKGLPLVAPLTDEEKKSIVDYYTKFGFTKIDPIFHTFYKNVNGYFDTRFLPETIYYRRIDKYFNNWDMAKYLDNKTFYQWLFNGIAEPVTICQRVNGFWVDKNFELTSLDALEAEMTVVGCFCKIANESYGGKGVRFCKSIADIKRFADNTDKDIIIQTPLTQHEFLSSVHSDSINTVRIISLLKKSGEVKIYSTILRMGQGGNYVDNASSGGITVGINESGKLNDYAYSVDGIRYSKHPTSGFVFSGKYVPGIEKARELVLNNAHKIPHFRLVSWDIAIDIHGNPILIEANLCDGELDFHQINNGPLFGDDTDEILREITSINKIGHSTQRHC